MNTLTPEELAIEAMSTRAEVYEWQAKIILAAIRSGKIPGVAWYPHGNAEASREMDAAVAEHWAKQPKRVIKAAPGVREEADILRARVAELELERDTVEAALRDHIAGLEATATYAGKGTAKDWAEMCGAAENKVEELEHGLAVLEAQAKAHAEALVIARGVGFASRNDEFREIAAARKDAESRLWDSQRLKDNYSSELKVVIGERDALALQMRHQSVNLAEYLAGVNACAIAKAMLADAQVHVRGIIEENAENLGERLMHKQQPAIDCDAAITAFLEGQK